MLILQACCRSHPPTSIGILVGGDSGLWLLFLMRRLSGTDNRSHFATTSFATIFNVLAQRSSTSTRSCPSSCISCSCCFRYSDSQKLGEGDGSDISGLYDELFMAYGDASRVISDDLHVCCCNCLLTILACHFQGRPLCLTKSRIERCAFESFAKLRHIFEVSFVIWGSFLAMRMRSSSFSFPDSLG